MRRLLQQKSTENVLICHFLLFIKLLIECFNNYNNLQRAFDKRSMVIASIILLRNYILVQGFDEDNERCWKLGVCLGHQINIGPCDSANECLAACKSDDKCEWISFSLSRKLCYKSRACYQVLTAIRDLDWTYASRKCSLGKCVSL